MTAFGQLFRWAGGGGASRCPITDEQLFVNERKTDDCWISTDGGRPVVGRSAPNEITPLELHGPNFELIFLKVSLLHNDVKLFIAPLGNFGHSFRWRADVNEIRRREVASLIGG